MRAFGNVFLAALLLFFVLTPSCKKASDARNETDVTEEEETEQVDPAGIQPHPRLLLLQDQEKRVTNAIETNPLWKNLHDNMITECNAILALNTAERILIGKRLLQVSRESLRRIFYLSYAWRFTGKKEYLKRCEEELLAVSNFVDWNPDHFLDVAEMSLAVSIGYDWLYNDLSEESRKKISAALISKGIQPALDTKTNSWLRANHNWNQVCNAGITFAALAVYEDQTELSESLISRAVTSIKLPMALYDPDGNYAEGYSYWAYGTSFNVLLADALTTALKNDYGLSSNAGFMKTASFYKELIGPSRNPFNYSDCGGIEGLQPAMFWFADKLNDPSLLFIEKGYLNTSKFNIKTNRLLPAALVWGSKVPLSSVIVPTSKVWAVKTGNQVAVLRSAWGEQGIYAGFKGGTPAENHGHMDIGSFVLDAEGVRWSSDLGMQDYNSLESAGVDLWNMSQNSERWQVFRLNNYSHSTLTVNQKLQNVNGTGTILKYSDDASNIRAVMDLSTVYNSDLKSVRRGLAIVDEKYVGIRDEIETGNKECTIRWAMLTPATIVSNSGKQLVLSNMGKRLTLMISELPEASLQSWSTDPPKTYDAPNPGTRLVGFQITVPANTRKNYSIYLVPESSNIKVVPPPLKDLSEW